MLFRTQISQWTFWWFVFHVCVCVCVCVHVCVRERLHISPTYQLIDDQTEASDSNKRK